MLQKQLVSCFLGITLGRKIEKLGMRSSDTAEIFFNNVKVPISNIIGLAGDGFKYQMQQFQTERLIGCALSLFIFFLIKFKFYHPIFDRKSSKRIVLFIS